MVTRYVAPWPTLFGEGAVQMVGAEAKALGGTKAILVSDEIVAQQPGYAACKKSLNGAGIAYVEFLGGLPDAPDNVVNQAAELARKEKVDVVIAFGGGSNIDAAKAVSVLVTNPGLVKDYYGVPLGEKDNGTPMIAIPTTSGTGSEATTYAVIGNTEEHVKSTVYKQLALAIVDPELTYGMPPSLTAGCGCDVMAHSVEGLFSTLSNPFTNTICKSSFARVFKYLPRAVKDGSDKEARGEMALASNFAGIGFGNTANNLGHAVAHAIGAAWHVPHGVACGLVHVAYLEVAAPRMPEGLDILCDALGYGYEGRSLDEKIEYMTTATKALLKEVSIPSFKELGYTREQVVGLSGLCMAEGQMGLLAGPPITEAEVKDYLGRLYDNYS